MSFEEHYKKLENMYLSAPCNEFYKPKISISQGRAEIRIKISPKFYHAAHAVHGSIYFKMMDDAAFFAVNSLIQDVFVVTSSFQIYFLRPVFKGELLARGQAVFTSKRVYIGEALLLNEGKEVGRGSGVFLPTNIHLAENIGYE